MIHHVTVYDFSDTIVLDFDTKFDSLEKIHFLAFDLFKKKYNSHIFFDSFNKLFYVHVVF